MPATSTRCTHERGPRGARAVKRAKENARKNRVNAEFIAGPVEERLAEVATRIQGAGSPTILRWMGYATPALTILYFRLVLAAQSSIAAASMVPERWA